MAMCHNCTTFLVIFLLGFSDRVTLASYVEFKITSFSTF